MSQSSTEPTKPSRPVTTGKFWYSLIMAALVGTVIWQQFLIADLSNQIYQMNDDGNVYGFHSRIDNLEGRSNRDSDRIDALEKELYQIKSDFTETDWRLKQIEWHHPDLVVPHPVYQSETVKDFEANPAHIPDVPRSSIPQQQVHTSPFRVTP